LDTSKSNIVEKLKLKLSMVLKQANLMPLISRIVALLP
jgi:hypothetical protein